jgi:hypothetical protein
MMNRLQTLLPNSTCAAITWHTTDLIHRPAHPADLPRPPPRNRGPVDPPALTAAAVPASIATVDDQVEAAGADEDGAQLADHGTDGAPPAKKPKVSAAPGDSPGAGVGGRTEE